MTGRKQTFSVKYKRKLFQGEIIGCLFFKIQPRVFTGFDKILPEFISSSFTLQHEIIKKKLSI
jgi:hypothetical protein